MDFLTAMLIFMGGYNLKAIMDILNGKRRG